MSDEEEVASFATRGACLEQIQKKKDAKNEELEPTLIGATKFLA